MPKTRSRGARPTPNYQTYYIRVQDCEPSYGFSVNNSRNQEGPYWEHLEVTLSGIFLTPERVKGRRLTAVFFGRREDQRMLEEPPQSDRKPLNVGVLTVRGERPDFLGALPHDALWGLVYAFTSGTFRFVQLHGALQRGGRVDIQSIHFSRTVDLEDESSDGLM